MAALEDQDVSPGDCRTPNPELLRASPRLFENPLLDRLSRVHWSMPLIFYAPFVALLAWLSFSSFRPLTVGCMALLGYLLWTLTEYFGHRYLFHAEFPGAWGARIHLLIHGVHHDHPNDPLRLVMPPLLSAPIMIGALIIGRLIFGFPLAYPGLMGFVLGYLIYDMVHYYVHHADPKTRLGRSLRRLHMLHHFRDPERGFGVSAPWWDKIFGTGHVPQR
jgi:dihydroceramide fatty acyl 2-hydroxylase